MMKPALTNKRRGGRQPKDFSDEEWIRVARRLVEGATIGDLVSEFGVPERTFYARMERRGLFIETTNRRRLMVMSTGQPVPTDEAAQVPGAVLHEATTPAPALSVTAR